MPVEAAVDSGAGVIPQGASIGFNALQKSVVNDLRELGGVQVDPEALQNENTRRP